MNRFPLMNLYRMLLLFIVFSLITTGFLASTRIVTEFNAQSETELPLWFRAILFMLIYTFFCTFAIMILAVAEGVKLALFVEDHLFNIRHPKNTLELGRIAALEESKPKGVDIAIDQLMKLLQAMTELAYQLAIRVQGENPTPTATVAPPSSAMAPPSPIDTRPPQKPPPIAAMAPPSPAMAPPLPIDTRPPQNSPPIAAMAPPSPALEPSITTQLNIETMIQHGARAYNNGNLDQAIQSFEAAIDIDTDDPRAYRGLAAVYKDRGEIETAKEYYAMFKKLSQN